MRDRNLILKAMARDLYLDYGPGAYQRFVVLNPGGQVEDVETDILARMAEHRDALLEHGAP